MNGGQSAQPVGAGGSGGEPIGAAFDLMAYCQKRIQEQHTSQELCNLLDKMLPSPQLVNDEDMFEMVCEFAGAVNRSRRDDPERNWTREDFSTVLQKLNFHMTAADMQREATNPTQPPAMVDIETLTKPGDLIGYLNTIADSALEPIVVKAILEKSAKHAEAMLQAKKWNESVVDSVQSKVKELRDKIDPQPTQKELAP